MDAMVMSSTLGVNAAFLSEIKESHVEFNEILDAVYAACEANYEPEFFAKSLAKLLLRLRDCLSFRFGLEESLGYQEIPETGIQPTSQLARRARDQHFGLFLEVCSLCEQAELLRFSGFREPYLSKLVAETERFCATLEEHEQLEQEMIDALIGPF